jgi:hypothetical protein
MTWIRRVVDQTARFSLNGTVLLELDGSILPAYLGKIVIPSFIVSAIFANFAKMTLML